jgi:hypothetical protein
MSDQRYPNEETPVLTGPGPEPEVENPLVPASLATELTKAEFDQQIATAHAYPRSPSKARDRMIGLATLDEQMAEECIYSVPRGGKQIRGPSIRFAEIVLSAWGNVRCAARVTHEDRVERYVEAEALVHDLETNVGYVARARRRIELKRGRKSVDPDMIQLAGAAATSVARRNAILGAIPKTVWRRAQEAVEAVIRGDQKTLVERRDAAFSYFNKMGVPTERILKSLSVNHLDDITLDHLVDLGGMRSSLKSGDATLDQLFPEEVQPGPKPETLEDKLKAISRFDPETGEIKEAIQDAAVTGQGFVQDGQRLAPEAVIEDPPKAAQRAPRAPRKPSIQERIQADGDAAAAKGDRALTEWLDFLNSDEIAHVSVPMERAWRETAQKVAT